MPDIVQAVGHCSVTPCIGDTCHRCGVSDTGLVVNVVRPPESSKFSLQVGHLGGDFGTAVEVQGIGTVVFSEFGQLVADLVHCLIPGDVCPFAVDALHRAFQTFFADHHVDGAGTFTAMGTAGDRMILGDFLANPDTVLYFGLDTAADGTIGTDCANRFGTDIGFFFLSGNSFAG